jgi:hypothetical protein
MDDRCVAQPVRVYDGAVHLNTSPTHKATIREVHGWSLSRTTSRGELGGTVRTNPIAAFSFKLQLELWRIAWKFPLLLRPCHFARGARILSDQTDVDV